ncbi:hypothetical protein SteCoe_23553 [Stentor coeruleus]|uniref:C2H2-type domain-containing protein n=1 Tax=Stentor coeruleus TaxID=5963 RepID=A0A1R2BJM7_9CILI|nr:hypothetical protein SteCoe_23553 [Stentor coeruleus]
MEPIYKSKSLSTCPTCSKVLSSKQNLKQHMNIHTGDKPYKCLFANCQISFKHASQLSNHRMIHHSHYVIYQPDFNDFRAFIKLLIATLHGKQEISYTIPSGPFTIDDAILPKISAPQEGIKLPVFYKLMDSSN